MKSPDSAELKPLVEASAASLDRMRELRKFGPEELVYQMCQGLTPADEEIELLNEYRRELNAAQAALEKLITIGLGRE